MSKSQISDHDKNLHAATLSAIFFIAMQLFGARLSNAGLILTGVSIVWALLIWIRRFRIRRQRAQARVVALHEIMRDVLVKPADSLLLLSLVAAVCLMVLGWLSAGLWGVAIGVACGLLYALSIIVMERYPIV